ncbi:MAG: hypothetical protein HUU25_15265 [Candidatus Sumerlaeia bacterium]|nr:hypothetical protein [Candidatus Sumerlaeia bacterium]
MSQRRRTVIGLCVAALGLAPPAPATDYALASPFGIRALRVYAVSPSGEITLQGMSSLPTQSGRARVDVGGRFAVTFLGPHDLDIWRIHPNRTLSLAASVEEGPTRRYDADIALSQDARVILAVLRDYSDDSLEFRSFIVNNRLEPRATPGRLALTPDLGFLRMGLSDRVPYTALLTIPADQAVAVLSVSPSGEITDTGQRIATGARLTVPLDFTPDGRWAISGGSVNADIALFEIHGDGTVTLADSIIFPIPLGARALRFLPLDNIALGFFGDGLAMGTAAFSPDSLLGDLIDTAPAGFSGPEAMDVNPAGTLALLDDQSGAGQFSLYSYFLSPGGELTPTGFTLAKPFKLADLQFIPPRTPVTLTGDANVDGVVDAADVVFLVNEALPDDKPILLPPNFANADLDQDVDVDQDDLEALVAMLVGE